MTERKPVNISWESFIENQIREAQKAGQFDHLPGFGKPIPGIDEPDDELWWIKKKIRKENLSLLPPALQIRLDVEKTIQTIGDLTTEEAVRRTIESLNERIRLANFAITCGPSSTTMPLDVDQVVAKWKMMRTMK